MAEKKNFLSEIFGDDSDIEVTDEEWEDNFDEDTEYTPEDDFELLPRSIFGDLTI